ncbi:MAG: hypothetical protein FNP40_00665 [Dehalobacter sp. 4CP]|uniref:hypothetical protein n=1 Tax=Dehalobacter sp. CP TaxID=2594474 RepID=UPI0013C5943D|nr:hypothetical protein [Dehalobacter sp. 4CP]
MNYEGIANLVHECVKNPKSMLNQEKDSKVKPSQFSVIQKVISRDEVPGTIVTLEVGPMATWQ